jgi:uncharacterized repeat protein (TIGR03803 family)
MRQKKFWFVISGILVVFAVALILPTQTVAASKYKVLHRFHGKDGHAPEATLIFDVAGNLYGTTMQGGGSTQCSTGCGTVFKLTPNSDGSWTESVLYRFSGGADGNGPIGGLIFDAAGDLYGTTLFGGASGSGTVFKMKPNADGSWTESVLHTFTGADGANPWASLVFDMAGNLYSTTASGGAFGNGVVFMLAPNSDGTWTETVLHSFAGADGSFPVSPLIFDTAGNLYGTTFQGGSFTRCGRGCGIVFKLTPNSDGSWTESVLHSFTSGAGKRPFAGVIFDAAGNLYGTATTGQKLGNGAVFKLTPNSDGSWTESVLHNFTGGGDGSYPYAGLTPDAAGNLYGATAGGGGAYTQCSIGCGTVFKLTPNSDGSWTESVLHAFQAKPAANPYAGVVLDKAGHLYGTTISCGSTCPGAVFEVTP